MTDASGQPPKVDSATREVGGLKVYTVEFKGTYQGMGEASKADWMMRGAIVETPTGLLFIKMTGPAPAMQAAGDGWRSLIESIRKA